MECIYIYSILFLQHKLSIVFYNSLYKRMLCNVDVITPLLCLSVHIYEPHHNIAIEYNSKLISISHAIVSKNRYCIWTKIEHIYESTTQKANVLYFTYYCIYFMRQTFVVFLKSTAKFPASFSISVCQEWNLAPSAICIDLLFIPFIQWQ